MACYRCMQRLYSATLSSSANLAACMIVRNDWQKVPHRAHPLYFPTTTTTRLHLKLLYNSMARLHAQRMPLQAGTLPRDTQRLRRPVVRVFSSQRLLACTHGLCAHACTRGRAHDDPHHQHLCIQSKMAEFHLRIFQVTHTSAL
jgi:hypothetical protein